jgi:hypothetical protein
MNSVYRGCTNITVPVCGEKVTNMSGAYMDCTNLTTPVCGPNVTDMNGAYRRCTNLTTPVCGNNVTNMSYTYNGCTNLTTAVCGPNVTNMSYTYSNCTNIQGNFYIYSNSVNKFSRCLVNRSTSNMLNIYVHSGSSTNTTVRNTASQYSITGNAMTWTTDTANNCSYNTQYNIYIYPVANVEAVRIANGDPDYMGVI